MPPKKVAAKAKPAAQAKAQAKPAAKAQAKPAAQAKAKAKAKAKPAAQAKAKPAAKAKPVLEARPPSHDAFLASILADADDKKARLVYADLLQDAGDPRGEFIALQCARAELADTDRRAAALDASIDALLKQHKKRWTAALGENKGARYEYRRGFVEKLALDAADLLANAGRIFGAEPIEELSVWKIDESKTRLGKSRLAPILALPLHRIRRLSLARCKLTADDLAALAAATTLGSVEVLDLSNGGSDTIPIGALGAATSLPKLRELKIGGCMCGDGALADLARAPTLRFARLVAPRNDFTAAAGALIADATWAPGLEHLDLSSNEMFMADGLAALATSPRLTSLRSLKLEYCGLYEGAPDLILNSPVLAKLAALDLSSNMSREDYDRIKARFGDRLV